MILTTDKITDGKIGLVRHGLVSVSFDLEDRYQTALQLVERIDRDIDQQYRRHPRSYSVRAYYQRSTGALLTELDQVIHAILADDLHIEELEIAV